VWNKPKWEQTRENHVEPWSQRIPLREDLKDLRSILEYSDLSINMCSTMSLDFMIFNKPVINQVLGNKENGLFDDQRFLNYNHYKKVVESGVVVVAKSEQELILAINNCLKEPLKHQQHRKNILNLQITKPLEGTSTRIVDALLKLNK
jgi:CDP-glycerol glycerophosphotransferase (TagB/SpsB family)